MREEIAASWHYCRVATLENTRQIVKSDSQIRVSNPKYEIRNKFEFRNSNDQHLTSVAWLPLLGILVILIWNLFRISIFGFEARGFGCLTAVGGNPEHGSATSAQAYGG